jgi:hypothetical protein
MNAHTVKTGKHPLLDRDRMFIERMFPIKSEKQGQRVRMQGEVPWALAELAYKNYIAVHGNQPPATLEEIADADGWTWTELWKLLTGNSTTTLPIALFIGGVNEKR